jgi:hypothetical protein
MSVADDIVPPDEPIVLASRKHPLSQTGAVLLSGGTALLGLLLTTGGRAMNTVAPDFSSAWILLDDVRTHALPPVVESLTGRVGTYGDVMGPLALAVSLCMLWWGIMTYHRTQFLVTPRRVLVASGIVSREVNEITVNRIRGVVMHMGFLGGLCGYGNVLVLGFGDDYLFMRGVRRPLAMLRAVESVQI